jgi:hypothetical protein
MTDLVPKDISASEVYALIQRLEQNVLNRLEDVEARVQESRTTRTDWYKRVLDTLQVLAIIAGFGFTVSQVWRLQESTDIDAWNTVSTEWLKVDQYFVQNPDLKKYFYDGIAATPNDPNYEKVEVSAIYVLNFLDYAISTSDHILKRYPEAASFIKPDVWRAYIQETYFRSPAVCAFLRKFSPGYSPETRRLGAQVCPKP